MNLASNTAPDGSIRPSSVAAIHLLTGCWMRSCTCLMNVTGMTPVPSPVEVFGNAAELNNQIIGEVFGFDLAAFLSP